VRPQNNICGHKRSADQNTPGISPSLQQQGNNTLQLQPKREKAVCCTERQQQPQQTSPSASSPEKACTFTRSF
jgi:hypothetical protein